MHITNYAVNKANINFVQNNAKASQGIATVTTQLPTVISDPASSSATASASASINTSSANSPSVSSVSFGIGGSGDTSSVDGPMDSTGPATSETKVSHKRSLTWLWNWLRENGRDR